MKKKVKQWITVNGKHVPIYEEEYSLENMPSHPWGKDIRTNLLPMADEKDIKESAAILADMKEVNWRDEEVELNELTTRQDWLEYDKLSDMYKDMQGIISGEQTQYGGGVRVVVYNGNKIVIDGNHRVNVALLKKQKKMKVRIVDISKKGN